MLLLATWRSKLNLPNMGTYFLEKKHERHNAVQDSSVQLCLVAEHSGDFPPHHVLVDAMYFIYL